MKNKEQEGGSPDQVREPSGETEAFDVEAFAREVVIEMQEAREREQEPETIQTYAMDHVPPEKREKVMAHIEQLELQYEGRYDQLRSAYAHQRLGLLGRIADRAKSVGRKGLEIADLDTLEKAGAFAIELIPVVGLVYAVTGKRIIFEQDPSTGKRSVSAQDLSVGDRLVYIIGEVVGSGHILRGVKRAVARKGAAAVLREIAEAALGHTAHKLIHRTAEKQVKRK